MGKRRWKNMNSDCLVNILGRLDLESRLLVCPLVCKHWYQALVSPLCWQNLVFPRQYDDFWSRLPRRNRRTIEKRETFKERKISELIKYVVGRSQGCATTLVLPDNITKQDLIYVSDECSALKILSVPYGDTIAELIEKWKSLEVLRIRSCICMIQIIDKLSLHSKKLFGFCVVDAQIDDEVASAIVSKLPTIKGLNLEGASIEKVNLVLILRGCKQLETLYVRNCVGFDEDDEEILKLASGIKNFKCKGSRTYDSEDFEDHISHDDLVYGDCYSD